MIVPESRVSRAAEVVEVSLRDPLSLEGFQVEEQPVSEPVVELCVLCKKQRVVIEPGESVAQQSLCCSECVRPCGETDLQPRQATMTTRRKTRTQTIYRCKLCNYLTVVNFDVLLRHFRRMHKEVGDANVKHFVGIETKNVFHSVRSKTVSTAESIKDKYLKKRKVNDDIVQVKEEPMDVEEDDYEDESVVRMAKKRSPPKAKPPTTSGLKAQFDRGLVMEASQSAASNLKCVKCSFVADSVPTLRGHVTEHRTDRSALQCLECGECFVVLPSLEKHLAIRHHILDVDRYIADNPSCVPPTDADASDTLECSVCLSSFASRQELEKHTRTHGMAFLKQARTKS
ncbi:hypothetical protein LSTR_LSTR016406 [Laodelphax striatellus]|uniref:C2H2-type domain-containing protein n=1 Tax=Laodelphax striatellus TaxID=195883 RepID=A0A482WZS6_LAOST|nr:hypothetical protein LSTR_LSTR016406 [Laodelphax striatellus]